MCILKVALECSRVNINMCRSSEGGTFFSHQNISQRAVRTSLKKQLDPKGSNCFLKGSNCFWRGVHTHISKQT